MRDVIVIGGGPVGLAAAIEARLRGLTVTVIEQRPEPIDKACGEGLMPGAIPLLEHLGVHPEGMPLRGVGYYNGDASAVHRFEEGCGLGVRRTVLQEALTERATRLGVRTIRGKLNALAQDANGAMAFIAGGSSVRSRWLIGCDGLHSTVARLAGLASIHTDKGRRYGIRRHFAVEPWSDLVEVHYGPAAEIYVTPVGPQLVDITVLGHRGVSFLETIASIPAVAERLQGAIAVTTARGAGPFRQTTRARTAGRVLLAGDAAGYVDALTGEGMRLGLAQASAAVACIERGTPSDYEAEWKHVTRDFRFITNGLVAWADSSLRGGIVPAAARAPRLFGSVVERLAR